MEGLVVVFDGVTTVRVIVVVEGLAVVEFGLTVVELGLTVVLEEVFAVALFIAAPDSLLVVTSLLLTVGRDGSEEGVRGEVGIAVGLSSKW